jgi:hypothetical protein
MDKLLAGLERLFPKQEVEMGWERMSTTYFAPSALKLCKVGAFWAGRDVLVERVSEGDEGRDGGVGKSSMPGTKGWMSSLSQA